MKNRSKHGFCIDSYEEGYDSLGLFKFLDKAKEIAYYKYAIKYIHYRIIDLDTGKIVFDTTKLKNPFL